MLEAYEDADTQLNVTRHLRMEPSISDAIDLQLSKFSNPSDFVDGAPPVSLENGDSDRFLFDCEREKFWMKMDPARKISENKLDQDEEPNSAQKMKQKERLRKAKLMSGYYFLQMKDLYKKVSQDNSSEISLSSFGSQKTMRFDDKPIIEKIRTKLKRPRESHLEGSTISKKIHDTIIDSTRNIGTD